MAGYGVQSAPRTVASDDAPYRARCFARCVVLWDDGVPHAIVSVDVLGIPRSVHLGLRPTSDRSGRMAVVNIVLVATHTHNGPVIGDSLNPFIAYNIVDLGLVHQYTAWLQDSHRGPRQASAVRDPHGGDPRLPGHDSGDFSRNRAGTADRGDRDSGGRRRAQQWLACTRCCSVTAATPSAPAGRNAGTVTGPRGRARSRGSDRRLRDVPAGTRGRPGPGRRAGMAAARQPRLGDGDGAKAAVDGYGRELTGPISSQFREVQPPLDITPTPAISPPSARHS